MRETVGVFEQAIVMGNEFIEPALGFGTVAVAQCLAPAFCGAPISLELDMCCTRKFYESYFDVFYLRKHADNCQSPMML